MKTFFLIFLFILTQPFLFSQNEIPEDDQKNISILIYYLSGKNVSKENQVMLQSIPILVYENIRHIRYHTLSDQEIKSIRERIINTELEKAEKILTDKYKKTSNDFFIYKKGDDYQVALEDLEKIKSYKPSSITIDKEKEIIFIRNEEEEPFQSSTAEDFSDNADYIISGSIEEIEGYLKLDLFIKSSITDSIIYEYNTAGSADIVIDKISEIIKKIKIIIYGKEYTELSVNVSPPGTVIVLDNNIIGKGFIDKFYLTPGEYVLELKNGEEISRTIDIKAENMMEIAINEDITIPSDQPVLLWTVPNGADIYIRGTWQGRTPLVTDFNNLDSHLVFDLDGFRENIVSDPQTAEFPVYLEKEKNESAFIDERKLFYDSLALFVVTLPYTIFNYTYAMEYTNVLNNGTFAANEERNRFKGWLTFHSINFIAGAFVNLFLFLDMTDHLIISLEE